MSTFTHFDAQGQAHMVDVADKAHTHRVAVATGTINMQAATWKLIESGTAKKGDVLGIARIAGIQRDRPDRERGPFGLALFLLHAGRDRPVALRHRRACRHPGRPAGVEHGPP